jgi:curved DNA-binding protein CbpA
MSELDHVLELFEFLNIDDISVNSLKKAFKKKVLQCHPDKGGSSEEFDGILAAFVYLTDTFQRINGGRQTLQNVLTPGELKEMRPDELINRVYEEFDLADFNKEFELKHNVSSNHGYQDWLKNNEDNNLIVGEKYGTNTIKPPTFGLEDFNKTFEENAKKNICVESIILHPEAMAYLSGTTLGTEIIETTSGNYTSGIFYKPEYTDVYSAFTKDNTISDKVNEVVTERTLEQLISERDAKITPFDDNELKAIAEFEKKKLEENTNNLSKIKEYFEFEGKVSNQIQNWPPEKYGDEDYGDFIRIF